MRRLSFRKEKVVSTSAKKKWGLAINEVRRSSAVRKNSVMSEVDPFLQRFAVTGRAFAEAEIHEFQWNDLLTRKYWKELVVDPSHTAYFYWSIIMFFGFLYNVIVIILRICFDNIETEQLLPMWLVFDYLTDLIFFIDILVQTRVGFLEQGLMVKDTKRLTMVYIKSWKFVIDVFSILPSDFFYFATGIMAALRLNRIFKLIRVLEFFRLAMTHTNFPNVTKLVNLILFILILIHWNACFYMSISRAIGFGSDGWVYPDVTDPKYARFWDQYLYCFYWSTLTLTTIGDVPVPETPFAYLYCIIDSLVGVLIFATIFGNVGAIIAEMDAARTEFQQKVDSVKRYIKVRKVGNELGDRVVKWFEYTWNNKQSVDDRKVLEALPEKLRAEISIHVHLNTLRRVSIFQDCEPGLLVELVLKLRLQVFSPGDYVCKKGDIGKDMYIVKRGKLQVVSEDGKTVFVTLSDGSVFGEVSVLNIAGNKTGNRRTASVRSVGYSDLFCLSKNDLWIAIEEYPEAKKLLSERGKQILRKDNLLDEEAARKEELRQQDFDKKLEIILEAVDDIHNELCSLTGAPRRRSSQWSQRKQSTDSQDSIEEEKET